MKKKIDLKETIILGGNAYGATRSHKKTTVCKKCLGIDGCMCQLHGIVGETWKVTYFPEWAKKYPMWLNTILFFLFNNRLVPHKWEKYL